MSLRGWLNGHKTRLQQSTRDLSAPGARSRAWWHFMFFDHGILRTFWHNFAQIAPGVYRANQPSPKRLARYAQMGIRTIVNLRGEGDLPHHQFETEACADLGLQLICVGGLSARAAPQPAALKAAIDVLRQAEKPMLIHCKSGADRSALLSAIYLLVFENATVAQARKQFSPRFVHFKWTLTGVLDHILDSYAAAQTQSGVSFEHWLNSAYDAEEIQAEFDAGRR